MKLIEDYVPFGIEWKAELKKTPKDFLIEQLRTALIKNQELQEEVNLIKIHWNQKNNLLISCGAALAERDRKA